MKKILAVIGVIVFGVGAFFLGYFWRSYQDPDMMALQFVLEQYKKYYYEEDEKYVQIMANSLLDEYSKYYTAEEYDVIRKSSQGVRSGVGMTIASNQKGKPYVYAVLGNSPAEHAGITVGGVIVGIKTASENEFLQLDYNGLSTKLAEIAEGEEFSLKILYENEKVFTLAKRTYNETFVYYADASGSYRFSDFGGGGLKLQSYEHDLGVALPDNTAYVQFKLFNGLANDIYGSVKQFEMIMQKFKEDGRSKLIMDLRGNGGGYMSIMQEVASHLIGERGDNLCLSRAIYKDGSQESFNSHKNRYLDYQFSSITFLADQNTASASEAMIGACLDYDYFDVVKVVLSRSVLNGKYVYKTYGKGIMQTTIPNTDLVIGGALRLTTAKIFWPVSNLCIHGVGITKNIAQYSDKIIEAPYIENADYELICALSL